MKERKTTIKFVFAILTLLCLGGIFFFSSQVAEVSDGLSRGITDKLLRLFTDYEYLSCPEQGAMLFEFNEVIRSMAHFGSFLLLGVFLYMLLSVCDAKWPYRISFALCALYGIADELHQQLLTDGRGFQIIDLAKDWTGALVGGLVGLLTISVWSRRKARSRGE